jgi:hypothetical protein
MDPLRGAAVEVGGPSLVGLDLLLFPEEHRSRHEWVVCEA